MDYYKEFCNDPMKLISEKDLFQCMESNDGTVWFVGMVSSVQYFPQTNSTKERLAVVFTNNTSGVPDFNTDWKVMLMVWEKDVKRFRPFFDTSFVLHVIGAAVRSRFFNSGGNVQYDLMVRDYTKIQVVGKIQMKALESIGHYSPIILNDDIIKHDEEPVSLTAFLKLDFLFDSRRGYCEGVIAYEKFKFSVRCCDASLAGTFKIGMMLKLHGILKCSSPPYHLEVNKKNQIQVIPGKTASAEELRKAVYVPRKRSLEIMEGEN